MVRNRRQKLGNARPAQRLAPDQTAGEKNLPYPAGHDGLNRPAASALAQFVAPAAEAMSSHSPTPVHLPLGSKKNATAMWHTEAKTGSPPLGMAEAFRNLAYQVSVPISICLAPGPVCSQAT